MSPWASGDSLTPSTLNARVPSWVSSALSATGLGVYSVTEYGATGNGSTDDSAAIQSAARAAALADGILKFPPLTYRVTSKVTILSAVQGDGALIASEITNGPTLELGTATDYYRRKFSVLPRVQQSLKTTTGWAYSTDIGVRLLNTLESFVWIPHVRLFAVGVDVRGEGTGNVYNTIALGQLETNKIGFQSSSDNTGWSNENVVLGGRWFANSNEGAGVSGARFILLSDATSPVTNWKFLGGSVEGDVPECHVETYGSDNIFEGLRWECTTPAFRSTGSNASHNVILFGYDAHRITVTESSGATGTVLMAARDGLRVRGSGLTSLSLGPSASNRLDISVSSQGKAVYDAVGTDSGHSFNDAIATLLLTASRSNGHQLSLQADSSNYVNVRVHQTGGVQFDSAGTAARYLFPAPVVLSDGSSTTPTLALSSESSLGLYRSAASVLAQSYGTFSAPGVSSAIFASSATTAQSGATAKLGQGQLYFSVLSLTSNGGEFGFRSGNTVYRFFSDAVG